VNLTLKEVEHLYGSRGLVQVGWYSANISLHRWYPIPASPHTWPRRLGAQGIMSEAAQGFKGRSHTPPQPTPVPVWEPTYLSRTYLAHTLYVIRPLVHSCRCTCIRQCRVNAIGIGAGRTRCLVVCVRPPSSSPTWGVMAGPPHSLAAHLGLSGSKSLAPKSQRASAAHTVDLLASSAADRRGCAAAQIAERDSSSLLVPRGGLVPAAQQQACEQHLLYTVQYIKREQAENVPASYGGQRGDPPQQGAAACLLQRR